MRQLRHLLWLGLVIVVLSGAAPAAAQTLSPVGTATSTGPGIDRSDIAFDEINQVYLHVFLGGNRVQGRFVDANGTAIGAPFIVSTTVQAFAGWPRVTYSTGGDSGVFFVAYSSDAVVFDKSKNVFGQIVRFNGSGGELVGPAFPLSELSFVGTVEQQPGGIAYNPFTRQFLASWDTRRGGSYDTYVRLFGPDGTPLTGEINLSVAPFDQVAPEVAFDWNNRRYLAVWQGDSAWASNVAGTWARFVGEDGQPIGQTITVSTGGYQDVARVAYLPEAQQFLTFWRDEQRRGITDVMGRMVDKDGNMGGIFPLVATAVFDGVPDGDYSWSTRTGFVAVQHDSGFVWGAEFDAVSGQPVAAPFQASTIPPARNGGSTWPKVVAGPPGQFGLGYSANNNSSWVDRLQRPIAPVPGPRPNGEPEVPVTIDLTNEGAPNGSWFFAEGASNTQGFKTYYLIANENQAPVTVRGYFSDENGRTKTRNFVVPGLSRSTPELVDVAGHGSYGSVFQSLTPGLDIFVERSTYWGPGLEGSATEVATKKLFFQWFFAEGTHTQGFSNFFLLYNPTGAPVDATLTYMRDYRPNEDNTPVNQAIRIPPQTRVTVDANALGALVGRHFSTTINASNNIVAERAMYWGPNWLGGTASLGSQGLSQDWYFAEGTSAARFESFYLIVNPWDWPIDVTVELMPQEGGNQIPNGHFVVQPKSRYTYFLNAEADGVPGVAAHFFASSPIVAERAMYWGRTPEGDRVEGTAVMGSPITAREWHLPEGTTGGAFTTYLLVANPTQYAVDVNMTLFIETGGAPMQISLATPIHMAPRSRISLNMVDVLRQLEVQEGRPLVGSSFSTKLTVAGGQGALGSIVAEHSIYWAPDPVNMWRAGGGAMGIPR